MSASLAAALFAAEIEKYRTSIQKGGSGSGNFGHAGRPGEVGGSSPSEGGGEADWFSLPGGKASPGVSDRAVLSFIKAKLAEHPGMKWDKVRALWKSEKAGTCSRLRFRYIYESKILGKDCGDDFRKFATTVEEKSYWKAKLGGSKEEMPEGVKTAGRVLDEKVHDLATKLDKLKVEEKTEVGFTSNPVPATPLATLREYSSNVEKSVDRAALVMRMDPDVFRTKLTDALKATVANADVWIRISPTNLDKVLADGRFKNQHESKSSHGTFDPELRRHFEHSFLGVRTRADYATEHPIYGYLSGREDGLGTTPDGYDAPGGYGSIRVKLKSSARERATFTVGDSLHNDYDVSQIAERVTSPTYKAFPKWSLADNAEDYLHATSIDQIARLHGYVEAQVFGGVKLSDIDHISFNYKDQYTRFKDPLNKLGVKAELLPDAKEMSGYHGR